MRVILSFSKIYLPQKCHAYSWSCPYYSVLLEWPAILPHTYPDSNSHAILIFISRYLSLRTFTSYCLSLIYCFQNLTLLISILQKYETCLLKGLHIGHYFCLQFFQNQSLTAASCKWIMQFSFLKAFNILKNFIPFNKSYRILNFIDKRALRQSFVFLNAFRQKIKNKKKNHYLYLTQTTREAAKDSMICQNLCELFILLSGLRKIKQVLSS